MNMVRQLIILVRKNRSLKAVFLGLAIYTFGPSTTSAGFTINATVQKNCNFITRPNDNLDLNVSAKAVSVPQLVTNFSFTCNARDGFSLSAHSANASHLVFDGNGQGQARKKLLYHAKVSSNSLTGHFFPAGPLPDHGRNRVLYVSPLPQMKTAVVALELTLDQAAPNAGLYKDTIELAIDSK